MAYKTKYSEILEKYKNKQITRNQILEQMLISKAHLNRIIYHHRIKIWDLQKDYSDLDSKKIKNLIDEGYTKYQIATYLNCSYTKIQNYCKRFGIIIEDGRVKRKNPQREKEIINLYREGKTIRSIANHIGLTYQTVYEVLKKNKVLKTKKTRVIKENNKYYFPKRDKSRYAKMIYSYNN